MTSCRRTIRAALTPLSRCLAAEAREGLIPANPCSKLDRDERPKLTGPPMRVLTAAN